MPVSVIEKRGHAWKVPDKLDLHWAFYDGECLLHNATSGATHVLNEVGAQALEILQTRSVDAHELAACIVAQFELEPSEKFHKSIHRLLADFSGLGLIEPAPK